jgi:LPXTG-motif cell wall-anchored protein
VSSTGLVTAIWRRYDGSKEIIQSSTSLNGSAWSATADLSATGGNAREPQVTVSSTGLVTAIWRRYDGDADIIQSSTSQNGGAWSTPANLSLTGGGSSQPQLTVSSTGLVTAVWPRYNGSRYIIQSSTSQNGGAWSTPVDLSSTGGDALGPQVTVSSSGLFTAVWYRSNGIVAFIQSSTLGSSNSTTAPPITPATTPITPTLAATGAEVEWLALGSLIAVVAGAGFFALGRRKHA